MIIFYKTRIYFTLQIVSQELSHHLWNVDDFLTLK